MNKRETEILVKHIEALKTVRAFLEPHSSWESDALRRAALEAVREVIGPSEPRLRDFYDNPPRTV